MTEIIVHSKYPELNDILTREDKFILDENNNVIPANLIEWGKFFENTGRRIVKQEIVNDKTVSTVFIGIDHNFSWRKDYEPHKSHIFETMVFEKDYLEIYCERCSTWKEAEECHEKAVQWVKEGCNDND